MTLAPVSIALELVTKTLRQSHTFQAKGAKPVNKLYYPQRPPSGFVFVFVLILLLAPVALLRLSSLSKLLHHVHRTVLSFLASGCCHPLVMPDSSIRNYPYMGGRRPRWE